MAALGLGGKPYKKVKVTHLICTSLKKVVT